MVRWSGDLRLWRCGCCFGVLCPKIAVLRCLEPYPVHILSKGLTGLCVSREFAWVPHCCNLRTQEIVVGSVALTIHAWDIQGLFWGCCHSEGKVQGNLPKSCTSCLRSVLLSHGWDCRRGDIHGLEISWLGLFHTAHVFTVWEYAGCAVSMFSSLCPILRWGHQSRVNMTASSL